MVFKLMGVGQRDYREIFLKIFRLIISEKFAPLKTRWKSYAKNLGRGGGGSTPYPSFPAEQFNNGSPREPLKKPMLFHVNICILS